MAGDVLIYTADTRNVHSVEEITSGERLTLTLWFSRDKSHDEDFKLISFLTKCPFNCSNPSPNDYLPLPASQNMYWFPPEQSSIHQSGFDIRFARLHVLGYEPYPTDASSLAKKHSSPDFSEILLEPSSVVRGNELFDKEFANLSHLLQVVQFYHWKVSQLQRSSEFKMDPIKVVSISTSQRENIWRFKAEFLKDEHLAETMFHRGENVEHDWVSFCGTVDLWEAYTSKLWHKMVVILPKWIANQSIFYEPDDWKMVR